MSKKRELNAAYYPPELSTWQGRVTPPQIGPQYWYQSIDNFDFSIDRAPPGFDFALLGYQCDEGVRRNLGRVGAKEGPAAIRKKLGKLAYHNTRTIADVGDVRCIRGDMESCQVLLATKVKRLVQAGVVPIVLGGGHDVSFGHYNGLRDGIADGDKKIRIINFDAHFDLRPVESQANSGTPFNQILQADSGAIDYSVLGIQLESNTRELLKIADHFNVSYINHFECRWNNQAIFDLLDQWIEDCDYLYVTIDMDGFANAYAPGVSAVSPFGLDPYFVCACLTQLIQSKKLLGIDIAELNPKYDRDEITANLAARLINHIVSV